MVVSTAEWFKTREVEDTVIAIILRLVVWSYGFKVATKTCSPVLCSRRSTWWPGLHRRRPAGLQGLPESAITDHRGSSDLLGRRSAADTVARSCCARRPQFLLTDDAS